MLCRYIYIYICIYVYVLCVSIYIYVCVWVRVVFGATCNAAALSQRASGSPLRNHPATTPPPGPGPGCHMVPGEGRRPK